MFTYNRILIIESKFIIVYLKLLKLFHATDEIAKTLKSAIEIGRVNAPFIDCLVHNFLNKIEKHFCRIFCLDLNPRNFGSPVDCSTTDPGIWGQRYIAFFIVIVPLLALN